MSTNPPDRDRPLAADHLTVDRAGERRVPRPPMMPVEDSPREPLPPPQIAPQFATHELETPPPRRRRGPGCGLPALAVGAIALSLIVLALFLPPISLGDVIREAVDGSDEEAPDPLAALGLDFQRLTAGSPVVEQGGLSVQVTPDDASDDYRIAITALAPADYLAGSTPETGWNCETDLPAGHALASPVYSLLQDGTPPARLTLRMLPTDGVAPERGQELRVWNATSAAWEFVPSQLPADDGSGALVASLNYLPRCVALFREPASTNLVGVTLDVAAAFDPARVPEGARIFPAGARPLPTGKLQVVLPAGLGPDTGYQVIPLLQNYDDPAVIDLATVEALLQNPALRETHAREIAAFALREQNGFAGVAIDYRGLPVALRGSYSAFLRDLAEWLHSGGATLTVVLPTPEYDSSTQTWDAGAYDWSAIGQAADAVVATLPRDPRAYTAGGLAQRLIAWATGQVSRSDLLLGVSALSVEDQGDDLLVPASVEETLGRWMALELTPEGPAAPGDIVTVALKGADGGRLRSGSDDATGLSYLVLEDASGDLVRTLWVTDAAALQARLALAREANLGGVLVRDLARAGALPGLIEALEMYRVGESADVSVSALTLTPIWTVRAGDTVIKQTAGTLREPFSFTVPEGYAELTIDARLEGTVLGSVAIAIAAPTATPAPTVPPTATQAPTATPAEVSALPLPEVDPALHDAADGETGFGAHLAGLSSAVLKILRAGMSWGAFEVPYHPGDTAETHERLITEARANALNVVLSVTGDPADVAASDWADYVEGYAAFVGGLAGYGADAIEVWSEINEAASWPDGQLDPVQYVGLLAYSYEAIKAADPGTIVISGGVVPTDAAGSDGRDPVVWNDDVYLAALAEAGGGAYLDCVGVRYTEGVVAPDATQGDPRGESGAFYLPTVADRAQNAFGGSRPVCFTRLGYLSAEGLGSLPAGYEWASGITAAQQAEWLAGAAAWAVANPERVRLMMFWNVNYTGLDASTVAGGYAITRPDGSCPACTTIEDVMGE